MERRRPGRSLSLLLRAVNRHKTKNPPRKHHDTGFPLRTLNCRHSRPHPRLAARGHLGCPSQVAEPGGAGPLVMQPEAYREWAGDVKGSDESPSSLVYRVSASRKRRTVSRARQTILLTVLAALALLAALQWAGLLRLEQDAIVTIPVAAAHPAVRAGHPGARPGDRIASLRTEDLERVRAGGMGGRDPWRFVDPPPIPQRKSTEPQPEAQAPMALKPAESPLPHPDDFTLRYLGRFGPPEKHIAVFTDGRRVLNRQE